MKILNFNAPVYIGPMGLPLYWRDEQSGTLADAIEQYIYWAVGDSTVKPTSDQFKLIKGYLRYWINAPCWRGEELESLRRDIEAMERIEDLEPWLHRGLAIALDPL